MNKFSLSNQPAKYYVEQFLPKNIVILPRQTGGWQIVGGFQVFQEELPERGLCQITGGEDEIEILFEVQQSVIDPELIEICTEVLENILELDEKGLSIDPKDEAEGSLAQISISAGKVSFLYFATTFNSEWEAVFKRQSPSIFQYKSWDTDGAEIWEAVNRTPP